MEGCCTLKFLFATEIFFFLRTTVLLGGSSVKKLTELYDLKKLLCFGLCRYRLSTKNFFLAYANLVIILNCFILILGLQLKRYLTNTKKYPQKKFFETLNLFYRPELKGKERLNNIYPSSNIT